MEYAVQTVMTQCEQWADNTDMETPDLQEPKVLKYSFVSEENLSKVAEEHLPYGRKKRFVGAKLMPGKSISF